MNHVERTAERQNAGRLKRKGRRKRGLWTTAGFVEFRRRRYFYSDGREPGTFLVFDMRVGLDRHGRFTPAARELYGRPASISPSYHKTSEITELVPGDAPSDYPNSCTHLKPPITLHAPPKMCILVLTWHSVALEPTALGEERS